MNQIMMLAAVLKLSAQILREAVETEGRKLEAMGLSEDCLSMREAWNMLRVAKKETDNANNIFIDIASANLEEPNNGADV